MLKRIKAFTTLADSIAEVHPYIKMAWSVLSVASKAILAQKNRDERLNLVLKSMWEAHSFIEDANALEKVQMLKNVTVLLAQQTAECAYFIRDYARDSSIYTRMAKNLISDVDAKMQGYITKFQEIKEAFLLRSTLHTEIAVLRVRDQVESTAVKIILDDMPYARGARYDIEKRCLPGTRTAIIDELIAWINGTLPVEDSSRQRILLLSGVAGSGKSAIAHTIARHFDQIGRLGSSFCFSRSRQSQLRPDLFFSTISRDLADLDPQWRAALWKIVESNRALRRTYVVQEQFDEFIMKASEGLTYIGPVVIVVDALDESGDVSARRTLLSILAKRVSQLPPHLRIIITTRPEQDILRALIDNPLIYCKHMEEIDQKSTLHDISTFIEYELEEVPELEKKWPSKSWLKTLVDRSEGLFQWAFTACIFIRGDDNGWLDPVAQMDILLSSSVGSCSKLERLDQLYLGILNHVFPSENSERLARFKSVLGEVLAAVEPLPISALVALRGVPEARDIVTLLIRPLGAVLSGVSSRDAPVRPLHSTFRDFLIDERRSHFFYVDVQAAHSPLLSGCIRNMTSLLRFNICELPSSYLQNSAVPNIERLIQEHIPLYLTYACTFWTEHLRQLSFLDSLAHEVRKLLESFALFWLEVLSILNRIEYATRNMKALISWSKNSDLEDLGDDIEKFLEVFGQMISESTPHLYISALPFIPTKSKLFSAVSAHFPRLLSLPQGRQSKWPPIRRQLHHPALLDFTFTSDGTKFVSTSSKTIRIWNLVTGNVSSVDVPRPEILQHPARQVTVSPSGRYVAIQSEYLPGINRPCQGVVSICEVETGDQISIHEAVNPNKYVLDRDCTCRLSFSTDEKLLFATFLDGNIYVWDVLGVDSLSAPKARIFDSVIQEAIAISPDGQIMATGYEGVRFWNTQDGSLKHRANAIGISLAFMPDGKSLVIADGGRICVMEVISENVIQVPGPLHRGAISMIACSPNGSLVAAGYHDKTISLSRIDSGQRVFWPTEGHQTGISRIAFSPDGKVLASSSQDGTIIFWNTEPSEETVSSQDHDRKTSFVMDMSPDGQHVVSALRSISMWRSETGEILYEVEHEPKDSIMTLTFTHSGDRFLTGSYRNGVHLWETKTGKQLNKNFGEHLNGRISTSSDVSPDNLIAIKYLADPHAPMDIGIWDLESCKRISNYSPGKLSQTSYAWLAHGKYLAVGDRSVRGVRVLNPQTAKEVMGPFSDGIHVECLAWSPGPLPNSRRDKEGYLAVGARRGTVTIWNITTRKQITGPLVCEGAREFFPIEALDFSPDCSLIAAAYSKGNIMIWHPFTGEPLAGPIPGYREEVKVLRFTSDGKFLRMVTDDLKFLLWDVSKILSLAKQTEGSSATSHNRDSHTDGQQWFKDASKPDDLGWLKGPGGELLLWIPPNHRLNLSRPSIVSSTVEGTTKLDFTNFVAGRSWVDCYRHSSSKS